MAITTALIEKLIFSENDLLQRFTQDSPVYPDVWLQYFKEDANGRVDLIFIPHYYFSVSKLLEIFRLQLQDFAKLNGKPGDSSKWQIATTGNSIATRLTLDELILVALPMTNWWQKYLSLESGEPTIYQSWLKMIAGAVLWSKKNPAEKILEENLSHFKGIFEATFEDHYKKLPFKSNLPKCLWSISLNRKIFLSLHKSVPATKADAARRVFNIDGAEICWAVIDSGIDATHLAFNSPSDPESESPEELTSGILNFNHCRIKKTYDFTRLRPLLAALEEHIIGKKPNAELEAILPDWSPGDDGPLSKSSVRKLVVNLKNLIKGGMHFDWSIVSKLIQVPHHLDYYEKPKHPHGTHVAGVLGGNMTPWEPDNDEPLVGMCPGIDLYDLRVVNEDGEGDEFNILAALQFVRWLNNRKEQPEIHGINISLSLKHDVRSFACGRTPVCEECNRLVSEGTIVVAAAGNLGRTVFANESGQSEDGFRTVGITDPGNAELVITVGATHRNKPHTYGVSYFSSRGPTGDGRKKPDLVAPGEKIMSVIPDNLTGRMDGTSMAAPHVSGAAALLISKTRELIGRPIEVKRILCETATDLNRDYYYQGAGMLDIFRALQEY